jgi:hypothetical protein
LVPLLPVAPVGPLLTSTIVSVAGWLVLVFSLLSNCTLVPVFA